MCLCGPEVPTEGDYIPAGKPEKSEEVNHLHAATWWHLWVKGRWPFAEMTFRKKPRCHCLGTLLSFPSEGQGVLASLIP